MAGRSLFISVEGIDGSGKSTQGRLLAETLRASGHAVTLTREPGGSPGAEEIRRLVLEGDPDRWSPETEILLFTAARRDHLEKTIRPALARGETVITDRFADSTRVYQGMTRGDLRATVDRLHDLMIGVEPDLTLLIDIDPEVGLSRALARAGANAAGSAVTGAGAPAGFGLSGQAEGMVTREGLEQRFEDMGLAMQVRMRAAFLALAEQFPARFLVIDGAHAPTVVAEAVAHAVRQRLATL